MYGAMHVRARTAGSSARRGVPRRVPCLAFIASFKLLFRQRGLVAAGTAAADTVQLPSSEAAVAGHQSRHAVHGDPRRPIQSWTGSKGSSPELQPVGARWTAVPRRIAVFGGRCLEDRAQTASSKTPPAASMPCLHRSRYGTGPPAWPRVGLGLRGPSAAAAWTFFGAPEWVVRPEANLRTTPLEGAPWEPPWKKAPFVFLAYLCLPASLAAAWPATCV